MRINSWKHVGTTRAEGSDTIYPEAQKALCFRDLRLFLRCGKIGADPTPVKHPGRAFPNSDSEVWELGPRRLFANSEHLSGNTYAISYHCAVEVVAYSQSALKALSRIPTNESRRIRGKIEEYAADPRSHANNVRALAGRRPYLRVGDWRMIMNDRGVVLDTIEVGRRGGSTTKTGGHMQKITTPNGEVLIVLAEAEYERLIDEADIARADKIMDDIEAGRQELIPAEFANRILDGENRIRVWREFRGMSARDLAAAAGLSPPYISEIESGKKEGTISAMKKIAEALKVDLDDLV